MAIFGLLTIIAWVLAYLFIAGVLMYTLLTFWKFIFIMVLYGVLLSIIVIGGVLLL